ncbi:MAG: type VI secretion system ATPase TssH [Lentisphaeraceae bacterium]|nr:type VI secretion system ATPase TssH [Lentisphaeraceae bacterium]
MADIQRTVLFGKLNSVGYKSLESATVFCKMRGNPHVEIVHWIQQLLQVGGTDLQEIIKHFEIDSARLATDVTAALDRLPRGATSISSLSSHLDTAMEQAWLYSTLLFSQGQIRSGHLVVGLLKTSDLKSVLISISSQFSKIKIDTLCDDFDKIVGGSIESTLKANDGSNVTAGAEPGEASGAMAGSGQGGEALAQFAVDLTEEARSGRIDNIVGRDEEIRQIVDILMRRRQNNPILTGEAGVGKTAVVEGFAVRVAKGDVPPPLKNVRVMTLDMGLLQAGASMKGEFENRLKQVIEEVQSSETPIILFIDEAHTLIGAGGAEGQNDAANLLKPALARGNLRTIAATTWAEYKKYFEKDPALTRRFQVVKVEEPSEDKAIQMLRCIASGLEKHHRIQLLDEAIEAAVKLSSRYIPGRLLPDKAVSLLDTACARVAIGQHATPAQVEDCLRRIQALETEVEIIKRETDVGMEHEERLKTLSDILEDEQSRYDELNENWQKEKAIVDSILETRSALRDLEQSEEPSDERKELLETLTKKQAELEELQGDSPLILPSVDNTAVGNVVADWTGIPVGRMVKDELKSVLQLADVLGKRVIGQDHALEEIAKRIQTSRAGLDNPSKPIGVFMLAGPSGVGKTETALSLAETLYGGEQNLITINMSEYQEAHTVSSLKGAPPGYVGYGQGGVLTEAVRRRPYSVVLLDEVEKAHPDVHELFFQVFDKGVMEDGEGRIIDFRNTVIILTSNVGSDLIMNMCSDPELMPDVESIAKALRDPMLKVFPAALLGRIINVPYFPISDEMLKVIINLQIGRIVKRLADNRNIPMTVEDEVVELIAKRCTEVESGGRMVDAILTNSMLPAISREYLMKTIDGEEINSITIGVKDGEFSYKFA